MNVKKLMDNMKKRDDLQHERGELKQELLLKTKTIEKQLNDKAKNSSLLKTIQSAFEETETNVKSGNEKQIESARPSEAPANSVEISQLKKALVEQSQKLRTANDQLD